MSIIGDPLLIGSTGGGGSFVIIETPDPAGGTVMEIIGTEVKLQSKSASPTESAQTVTPDTGDGYIGLTSVSVGAISSTYVGSGITQRSSTDLSANGATVTAPAGYYANAGTYTIASGSATTPSTNITATPSISVSSAGVITATASATKSITPTVSAGYVSSGTAGNVVVYGSKTENLTTQAAQTIYPSTVNQTISSGKYLTGTQTFAAVTTTNLTAANIKSGVTIEVGDSSDSDRVASVTGTYTGGGGDMNVQTAQSTTRRNNTALGSINSLTCKTTGTYDVYWTCARSNTSQTWGSQLYLGGTAYGTENTTWSNNVQNNHLTGVSISANTSVAVYGRSRSGYYIYAPQLTIVQTA